MSKIMNINLIKGIIEPTHRIKQAELAAAETEIAIKDEKKLAKRKELRYILQQYQHIIKEARNEIEREGDALGDRINKIYRLKADQLALGISDDYRRGLYNGLELALAAIDNRLPEIKRSPQEENDHWEGIRS